MAKMPEMIPVAEAAKLIGVSGTRVREYINAGRLPALKVGRSFVLKRSDVMSFERREAGRPKATNGQGIGPKLGKVRELHLEAPEETA